MSRLHTVLEAIDAANRAAPDEDAGGGGRRDLIYGQRMSAELARLCPEAGDLLQITARGQHIERWKLLRAAYPAGRTGYLTWRRDLARHHAQRVGEIMQAAGYSSEDAARAGAMLRKEGLKRDADTQTLEDVACMVFLHWYFQPFSTTQSPEKLLGIVQKTARKMSADGRERVLREFDLPDEFAAAFRPPA